MQKVILICIFAFGTLLVSAQNAKLTINNKAYQLEINSDGSIKSIRFNAIDSEVLFFQNKMKGPSWYGNWNDTLYTVNLSHKNGLLFTGKQADLYFEIEYLKSSDVPCFRVLVQNQGATTVRTQKMGLRSGIDTYMDNYPEWFSKYFPTLMRCEKTHFWGYFQSPSQRIIGIVCNQPVASWSNEFTLGYKDPDPLWFWGHRITSFNIDLLNALPLPTHNPQYLYELKAGEKKEWTFQLMPIVNLAAVERTIATYLQAPVFNIAQTSYLPGENATVEIRTKNQPELMVQYNNFSRKVAVRRIEENLYEAVLQLDSCGTYSLRAKTGAKESEAILTVRHPWAWYMKNARKACLQFNQKATSHAESWYGFYSAFIAAKYFPEKEIDTNVTSRFEYLYKQLHSSQPEKPKFYESRIQNTSTTIGMLVDKWEAYGQIDDLKKAAELADWMISSSQRKDGAYYNHGTNYTSVIYVAKSVLELAEAEKPLAGKYSQWKERYERHYESAKRAIDQLVESKGNFQTEGEHTFEDGMLSCSALQMGMLGILQTDSAKRNYYANAAVEILKSHNCLTQQRVPDGRQRNATLRYWEAQYDVQMLPNMFNSPHGWSAWRAYATYYAYLLTGDEDWLKQTINALGAFAQLIDSKSGKLRWAFVVDPYVQVTQACESDTTVTFDSLSFGNPHPQLYKTKNFIVGEQYVDMVSDWQTVNTQDNDVHEVFKCMGETVLANAFVVERANGDVIGYNCRLKKINNKLEVRVDESQQTNVHFNLRNPKDVKVIFQSGKTLERKTWKTGWLKV